MRRIALLLAVLMLAGCAVGGTCFLQPAGERVLLIQFDKIIVPAVYPLGIAKDIVLPGVDIRFLPN